MSKQNHDIRSLILDMDGVLWKADDPIGDLPQIFEEIRQRNLKVALATNNSTRTVDQYVERLAGFGVNLERWQIVTSSEAVAYTLKKLFPEGGPVFIIGETGLIRSLEEKGFYHSYDGALAVVAGMDRQLTYEKLRQATVLIRSGVPFYGTNPDRTFPTPYGLIPGTGSILTAIEVASDVTPCILGKPAPGMYQVAMERLGTTEKQTLVVGDRLDTDIAGAQKLGCLSALVLSGVTSPERAREWHPAPDWITADLSTLIRILPARPG